MAIEVDGEASLGVFGGSAGCDVFKKLFIFSWFRASGFSCDSRCTKEVVQLG
jgi:hypothetical protein